MRNQRAARVVLATLLCSSSSSAFAQKTDSVAAEALFRQGRELLAEGKIAEACTKFAASQEIEPSIGAQLNLADCREQEGRTATAWALFRQAAAAAKREGQKKRALTALDRARKLEERLSYLIISVPEASNVEGLIIERNGAEVPSAMWNQRIPMDPGSYRIKASAPGHEPWHTNVEVASGPGEASVEVPRFKRLADFVEEPAPPDPDATIATPAERPDRSRTKRKLAIAGAAVSGVALLASGVLTLWARSQWSDARERCPASPCADPDGVDLADRAQTTTSYATASFLVGAAAGGAAVVFYLLSRSKPEKVRGAELRPRVGATSATLDLVWRF